MSRDYPLAPTPITEFIPVTDGVTIKKGPNRTVAKRTKITDSGDKRVSKEVVNKRGYKSVVKVNGKRTEIGKSY